HNRAGALAGVGHTDNIDKARLAANVRGRRQRQQRVAAGVDAGRVNGQAQIAIVIIGQGGPVGVAGVRVAHKDRVGAEIAAVADAGVAQVENEINPAALPANGGRAVVPDNAIGKLHAASIGEDHAAADGGGVAD